MDKKLSNLNYISFLFYYLPIVILAICSLLIAMPMALICWPFNPNGVTMFIYSMADYFTKKNIEIIEVKESLKK